MCFGIKSYTSTPHEFFQALSEPSYPFKIEIKQGKGGFQVIEQEKRSRLSRALIGIFCSTDIDSKEKLANSLVKMTKAFQEKIGLNWDCNLNAMKKNLQKIEQSIVKNTSPEKEKQIRNKFSQVRSSLDQAYINKYAKKNESIDPDSALDRRTFYSQLSNTGWFLGLDRFNQRIHILERKEGGYQISFSPKESFFAKTFGKVKKISDHEKIATFENLAAFIKSDKKEIRNGQYDTQGLIANINRIKARMTQNVKAETADRIRFAVNIIIDDLEKIGDLIQTDIENSMSRKLSRCMSKAIQTSLQLLWRGGVYTGTKLWSFSNAGLQALQNLQAAK